MFSICSWNTWREVGKAVESDTRLLVDPRSMKIGIIWDDWGAMMNLRTPSAIITPQTPKSRPCQCSLQGMGREGDGSNDGKRICERTSTSSVRQWNTR